jgi:parallel beta-helix repeat protein
MNCYGENCVYGVAVQDHGEYPTTNVRVVGNTAVDCETLVDAQTSHPPENVAIVGNTGRRLSAGGMGGPGGIHLHLIEGLVVANNVLDRVDGTGISVTDCEDVTVTGNVLRNVDGSGVELVDSDRVSIDSNGIDAADRGIGCEGGESGVNELQVSDNRCSTGGITLDGAIDRYLVSGNLLDGAVTDRAQGDGLVANNLE